MPNCPYNNSFTGSLVRNLKVFITQLSTSLECHLGIAGTCNALCIIYNYHGKLLYPYSMVYVTNLVTGVVSKALQGL